VGPAGRVAAFFDRLVVVGLHRRSCTAVEQKTLVGVAAGA
jgi:hypothetical protein